MKIGWFLLLCLFVSPFSYWRAGSNQSAAPEPSLPVVDENACPFEGCTFGKWIVIGESTFFSSWKGDRKPLGSLKKGQVVTGLTGVHVTLQPDRIEVVKPIPQLRLQAGGIFLRYMYHGEGFADIWVKGEWKKEYDCSFITEKDGSGCSRNCSAKVISEGRKEWWVRVKTSQELIGWTKVEDQFDCMDSLGGDPKCAKL